MEAESKPVRDVCQHCGDEEGNCVSMRCLRCEALLCSRSVVPALASNPYYPYKHRVNNRRYRE